MSTKTLIKNFIYQNKKLFFLYIITIILLFPCETIGMTTIYGKIFNVIGQKHSNSTVAEIKYYLIMIGILWFVIRLFRYLNDKVYENILPKLTEYIRSQIFNVIVKRYKDNYEEVKIGEIFTNLFIIPDAIYKIVDDLLILYIPNIFGIIVVVGYFYYVNTEFALIATATIILIAIIIYIIAQRCIKLSILAYEQHSNNNENIQDRFSNLFDIYISNNQFNEIKENSDREKVLRMMQQNTIQCGNHMNNMIYIVVTIAFILMFLLIFNFYKYKTVTTPVLITMTLIITYYFTYIKHIITDFPQIINIMGLLKRFDIFLEKLKIEGVTHPDIIITNGNISIKNLTFSYPGQSPIINNLNLEIKGGTKIAFFGKSGSGKTTLLKLMLGFHPIKKDTILIDGNDISTYNTDSIRSNISFANQSGKLFNKSVIYNIGYGTNATHDKINEYMKENNLLKLFNSLPTGINSNAGVNGTNLSRGQRQVVILLRTILKDTKIIIVDEPTTGLDKTTKQSVLDIIKNIDKTKTVIIVSHDNDIIPLVDNVFDITKNTFSKNTF